MLRDEMNQERSSHTSLAHLLRRCRATLVERAFAAKATLSALEIAGLLPRLLSDKREASLSKEETGRIVWRELSQCSDFDVVLIFSVQGTGEESVTVVEKHLVVGLSLEEAAQKLYGLVCSASLLKLLKRFQRVPRSAPVENHHPTLDAAPKNAARLPATKPRSVKEPAPDTKLAKWLDSFNFEEKIVKFIQERVAVRLEDLPADPGTTSALIVLVSEGEVRVSREADGDWLYDGSVAPNRLKRARYLVRAEESNRKRTQTTEDMPAPVDDLLLRSCRRGLLLRSSGGPFSNVTTDGDGLLPENASVSEVTSALMQLVREGFAMQREGVSKSAPEPNTPWQALRRFETSLATLAAVFMEPAAQVWSDHLAAVDAECELDFSYSAVPQWCKGMNDEYVARVALSNVLRSAALGSRQTDPAEYLARVLGSRLDGEETFAYASRFGWWQAHCDAT